LNDRPTLEQLLEIQQHFGLPSPALVEKDWYVVKALAAGEDQPPRPLALMCEQNAILRSQIRFQASFRAARKAVSIAL
jgi:hypothetical protein